jgi:hypothetical protein
VKAQHLFWCHFEIHCNDRHCTTFTEYHRN